MYQLPTIVCLTLSSVVAFIFSISGFTQYTPQVIALISIISMFFIKKKLYLLYLISLLVSVIVFTTNGLSSPVFFLIYFLLFVIAFQNPPVTTLSFSLVLVLLLSNSLNSIYSLLPLLSLLFITPLAFFIGRQHLENLKLETHLSNSETQVLFWMTLKFKTGIYHIIDSTSQLLSQPQLSHSQKEMLKYIRDSAKNLLNSSKKLVKEIDEETDND